MIYSEWELQRNSDGSFDLILHLEGEVQAEFAADFFQHELIQKIGKGLSQAGRIVRIRSVRMIVAGALVLAMPFASASAQSSSAQYAMSYVYFGTAAEQIKNIARTGDTLDTVSPSYFDLNTDGSLKLNTPSASFLDAVRKQGLKVVPFLSNHWDRAIGQKALQNTDRLVEQLADAVRQYGFDGVNVDIENVTQNERSQYTEFVRKLRAALPSSKSNGIKSRE